MYRLNISLNSSESGINGPLEVLLVVLVAGGDGELVDASGAV